MTTEDRTALKTRIEAFDDLERQRNNLVNAIEMFPAKTGLAIESDGTGGITLLHREIRAGHETRYSTVCWQKQFPELGLNIVGAVADLLKRELERIDEALAKI